MICMLPCEHHQLQHYLSHIQVVENAGEKAYCIYKEDQKLQNQDRDLSISKMW